MRITRPRPRNFGLVMFLTRLSGTLFLVLSTYNLSGYSLVHWIEVRWSLDWMLLMPLVAFYIILYFLLLRVTLRALRPWGILFAISFLGSLAYALVDADIVPLRDTQDLATITLYMFGSLMGIGICWASAWVMVTGQVSVDNVTY